MSAAIDYMEARAIDPQIAAELGVKGEPPNNRARELHFPNGRRRVLKTGRVLQPKGKQLEAWWIPPPEEPSWEAVLVCEGESDALAVRSYLPYVVESSGLRHLPILCIPGTGFPVERLRNELVGRVREALIATDADEAGEAYYARAHDELVDVGIRPVRVEAEPDLAEWLANMPEAHRPFRLADLLVDCAAAAPDLEQLARLRKARLLREEANQLELEAAA